MDVAIDSLFLCIRDRYQVDPKVLRNLKFSRRKNKTRAELLELEKKLHQSKK